jgi:hypothetical protein
VERHLTGSQRLEDIPYIDFWATCDTYMKVWYIKVNELLYKLNNPLVRCWNPREARTFIKGVKY